MNGKVMLLMPPTSMNKVNLREVFWKFMSLTSKPNGTENVLINIIVLLLQFLILEILMQLKENLYWLHIKKSHPKINRASRNTLGSGCKWVINQSS